MSRPTSLEETLESMIVGDRPFFTEVEGSHAGPILIPNEEKKQDGAPLLQVPDGAQVVMSDGEPTGLMFAGAPADLLFADEPVDMTLDNPFAIVPVASVTAFQEVPIQQELKIILGSPPAGVPAVLPMGAPMNDDNKIGDQPVSYSQLPMDDAKETEWPSYRPRPDVLIARTKFLRAFVLGKGFHADVSGFKHARREYSTMEGRLASLRAKFESDKEVLEHELKQIIDVVNAFKELSPSYSDVRADYYLHQEDMGRAGPIDNNDPRNAYENMWDANDKTKPKKRKRK